MREFQQRRIFRHFIYSKFSIFLLFIVFIFFVFSTAGVYEKKMEAARKNSDVEKGLNDLKAKKDYLEAQVNRLNTDAGAEEELRDKFQIAKPGEKVLIIVNDNDKNTAKEPATGDNKSWFRSVFGL